MYYANYFTGVRPFEPTVLATGRERPDNPLDLSIKNPSDAMNDDNFRLLLEQGKLAVAAAGLSTDGFGRQIPLIDPLMYSRLPPYRTGPQCPHPSTANNLLGPAIPGTSPFCGTGSPVATNPHLGLMPTLLSQQNRDSCLDPPSFMDTTSLPFHMRLGASRSSLFAGPLSGITPHLAPSFTSSIPHFALYSDLLTDMNRRSESEKDAYLRAEPTTRFSDHLQRLREQHHQQISSQAACCIAGQQCCVAAVNNGHLSSDCGCCANKSVACLVNASESNRVNNATSSSSSASVCVNEVHRQNVCNNKDSLNNVWNPSVNHSLLPNSSAVVNEDRCDVYSKVKIESNVESNYNRQSSSSCEVITIDEESRLKSEPHSSPATPSSVTATAIVVNASSGDSHNEQTVESPEAKLEIDGDGVKQVDVVGGSTCEETRSNSIKTKTNLTKQLKEYKIIAKNHKSSPKKETKTIEIQCDGPDWTPIVLPQQFKNRLLKSINRKLTQKQTKESKKKKRSKKDNEERLVCCPSPSPSGNSIPSSGSSAETRHHSSLKSACDVAEGKSRKRSMLDCLANSEGYVADKVKKKSQQTDLFASHPSQLDREQRAIQRAIQHIEKTHKRSKSDTNSENDSRQKNADDADNTSNNSTKNHDDHDNESMSGCESTANNNSNVSSSIVKRRNKLASSKKKDALKKSATKTKRKLREQRNDEDDEEERRKSDADECNDESRKQNQVVFSKDDDASEWIQKKVMCNVRRRRFRSGLDMIRNPKRKKPKTNRNCFEWNTKNDELRKMVSESSSTGAQQPSEMKRIMVNKALGETVLHRAARQGYKDVVMYCLRTNSCDINARDNAGYTALHECCSRGHLQIAKALLEYGGDVNASAAGGIRPIHDAVEGDHLELVRLLLSYAADPTISTYSGLTPLKLARSKRMVRFLRGFLGDITDDTQCDSNEPVLPWKFSSSLSHFDEATLGFDVFDGLPSDEEEEESDEFLLEVSDSPHVPCFRLCLPGSRTAAAYSNCVRLSDVLKQIALSKEEFTSRYPHINVITLSKQQFESSATCSHLLQVCVPLADSDAMQVLVLDDSVREALGIETIRLR